MTNLAGLHDAEAQAIATPGTWILHTVALSENPAPLGADAQYHWITRINWGYGTTGTLPHAGGYADFAQRAARYVASSHGCRRWIIGNETNLPREWPDAAPIYPADYARCYTLCREAIHALPGHGNDEVLIAGSGPWNNQLSYSGNPTGDWITYFADVLRECAGRYDGTAIHAYTHGYDPALVTSDAKMDAPFEDRYYHFRTYRDYCAAVPPAYRHLPCYLTEANGDGPWEARGLMPTMLGEIDYWNHSAQRPQIQCVIFYRYPRYDQFHIEGREDVVAEYRVAVQRGYTSPEPGAPPVELPRPPVAPVLPPRLDRDLDPALLARGVEFDLVTPPAGTGYWRIVKAEWLNEQEADEAGPDHHILGNVTQDGRKVADVPLKVSWPTGSTQVRSKPAQAIAAYNWDFPMSRSLNEFSVWVDDGNPSDKASGIGMGAHGNPALHTSTWIDYEWAIAEGVRPPPIDIPQPPVILPRAELVHPTPGATITQHMYQNPDEYARFNLAGHNGTDLGGKPLGTLVFALADGTVAFVGEDPAYGNYVRMAMTGLGAYAFFAHLQEIRCVVGQALKAGDVVGTLGSTGNSTGPHLHLEIRLHNEAGGYLEDTPMRNGRCDPETWCALHGLKL